MTTIPTPPPLCPPVIPDAICPQYPKCPRKTCVYGVDALEDSPFHREDVYSKEVREDE